MIFEAEIRQTKQSKRVSLDNVYSITLETNNPLIMDLGKLPSDVSVIVTVELKEDTVK